MNRIVEKEQDLEEIEKTTNSEDSIRVKIVRERRG